MKHLPAEFLKKIRDHLVTEEKRLAKEEEELTKEDPFLAPERDVGNPEFLEEAGEEIGHTRVEAEKGIIQRFLVDTRIALSKLKIGKYGVCEKCGEPIDRARLKVFPQARYCVDCEKKVGEKGS